MAAFKTGACLLLVGSVALLASRRPRVGAGLVVLGCLALLTVTCYSYTLLANLPTEEDVGDGPDDPVGMICVH